MRPAHWRYTIPLRLRSLFRRNQVDQDLDDELRFHLDALIAGGLADGLTPDEARRAALRAMDRLEWHKEECRDMRRVNWIEDALTDLRHTLRVLRKHPGSTALSVLTLALGIGAATAIFSVVYGVLMRPLPYRDANRIVAVNEVTTTGSLSRLADPNFDDFRDQSRSFQVIAKYAANIASVSGASQPTRTAVASVSRGFLNVFGISPILGRGFTADDDRVGAAPTALVSDRYWNAYLGAVPDLSHAQLKVDGTIYSIIGVLPAGFDFPSGADLWFPTGLDGENPSRTSHNVSAVGRLRDGVTVAQANQDISAIARRIHDGSAEQGPYLLADGMVTSLHDSITGKARPILLVLLGAVGFLLLVACANVANLLLAQVSTRERELAVRSALGAARGRLIRQFLAEAFVLSLFSGGLGVLGAFAGVAGLLALAPSSLPRLESVSVSMPVLAFAVGLSAAIAVGLGLFTVARATSGELRGGLVKTGRGQAGSHGSQRLGRAIVAAQIAITMVLVVGAGLFGRSLMNVMAVDPGFRVDGVITMDVSLPWASDSATRARQGIFFGRLLGRLRQIPGVRQVGATSGLPMDGGLPDGMFLLMTPDEVPRSPAEMDHLFTQKERQGNADFGVATEGYFRVLGIPLIRGRLFDERDAAAAPEVAVINAALARARWPGQDPIGRTIEFGNMDGDLRLLTIVGIVGDTHANGLDAPPRPTVYVNLLQRPRSAISITMLGRGDPRAITTAARAALHTLNPELPTRFRMLSDVYAASLGSRRFNALLIGCFGIIALLLATAGVFGAMAYSVSRRTREIGVRVALGAATADVLRMVMGQGLRTIVVGVVIGVAGSLLLTRTVASLLFGVTATDPVTFGGVTLLLVTAGLLACYVPARRTSKVDPMVALRAE